MKDNNGWLEHIGAGWQPIVKVLLDFCTEHNIQVLQVKEKFGGLRFYYYADPDTVDTDTWQEIKQMVEAAERLCNYMCETCGAPGKKTNTSWIKTACPAHTSQREQWEKNKAEYLRAFQI